MNRLLSLIATAGLFLTTVTYANQATIIDNRGQGFQISNQWDYWNQSGFNTDYFYTFPNRPGQWAQWSFRNEAGVYKIAGTWVGQNNHATNAPFKIYSNGREVKFFRVDQTVHPHDFWADGVFWGTYAVIYLPAGTTQIVLTNGGANAPVVADAVRFEKVEGR